MRFQKRFQTVAVWKKKFFISFCFFEAGQYRKPTGNIMRQEIGWGKGHKP